MLLISIWYAEGFNTLYHLHHCPIRTATIHIESRCAYSGGQSRFGLVLRNGLGQWKVVPVCHPKPNIPLFRAVITVTAKWLYIQPIAT